MMARYLDRILARFERQKQKGISKYSQILEDNPRGPIEALEYLAEELTDGLMYIEEAIEKSNHYKNEADGLNRQLFYLNESARETINRLSAQVATYRNGLEQIKAITQSWQGMNLDWDAIHAITTELLSSPDPDAKEG